MIDGITCPECGSERIAEVIYGMPAYSAEFQAKLDAGEIILNGCLVDGPVLPYQCRDCGKRFAFEPQEHVTAREFFSEEDFAWLQYIQSFLNRDESNCNEAPFSDDEEIVSACAWLALEILDNDPAGVEFRLEADLPQTHRWYADPTFAKLVVMGLEYGVACKDGACANWLGAMYYGGDIVEQDYEKAKALYELAEAQGIVQATINLGYIYEYGRTDKPDYEKAFKQYAKAAALYDAPEALYKLGDMYSRAKVVERDLCAAYMLYLKSLRYASDVEMQAQAAFRIAKLISDPENAEWGIPYDPMRALELYQLAERGLRIDVAHGQTHYTKRLQEAIQGQELMRLILDGADIKL